MDAAERELDAWMARLSQGDRSAFDPLFAALHPRALRFARAKLPADEAADAAQVILMNVFARANEFDSDRAVLPWFYAIAANEVHARRRRRIVNAKRTAPETTLQDAAGGEDPEGLLVRRELAEAIERAIATLDDESAQAVRSMLTDEERPPIPAATFRKRVSRAYARLRILLGGAHGS